MRRSALALLALLAGCGITDSNDGPFAEERHYAAAGINPEGGFMVILCPTGDAHFALGDDIVERTRYTRDGDVITLRTSPRTRLSLTRDGEALVYEDVQLRRMREFEGDRCNLRGE